MSAPTDSPLLASRWDDEYAATLAPAERLLYRSNLLGSDKRLIRFGGGTTSAKLTERDRVTGVAAPVLWVKGSGGDLGSMGLEGFATLYLDRLVALKQLYRGSDHEDEMVELLAHCTFGLNPRPASIDTPLHAFLPHRHVDHLHPDAISAIAASKNSRELTLEVYGETIGWLPWRRPGFELGQALERFAGQHPEARGVVLERQGLLTWGDDARACYQTTIETINTAIAWFAEKAGGRPAFLGARFASPAAEVRRAVAAQLMPEIRGRIGGDVGKVGHFDDSAAIREFVDSEQLRALAPLGGFCADHFLFTMVRPLIIDHDPKTAALDRAIAHLDESIRDYRAAYAAYYERCRHPDSPAMRDPDPIVYLVPGIGMITFARDKATARIAGEFYGDAISVMRGASMIDNYAGLSDQEAFDVEYRPIGDAMLEGMKEPKRLAGRIAVITGGASAIGRATAIRFLAEGAAVVIADVDEETLASTAADLASAYGKDNVRGVHADVTDEVAVARAFSEAVVEYGGVDILVSNAGISSSAPIEDTSAAMWDHNMDVLAKGNFLSSREAFRLMKRQKLGGAVVFVASKNRPAESPGTAAYSAAKAAELHLARGLALEGAPAGIRVNVVNSEAVRRGSKAWTGEWREQRAGAYNTQPDELEERYRKSSLLKLCVLPEDVAEAIYFLASDMAAKSTGNIINVDAGNAVSFTR